MTYVHALIASLRVLAHRFSVWCKRPVHVRELSAHLEAIFELEGCATAHEHLERARDITERYGITLYEGGYNGEFGRLKIEADLSVVRHHKKQKEKQDRVNL